MTDEGTDKIAPRCCQGASLALGFGATLAAMITVLWLLCGLGLVPLAFSQRRAVVDLGGGLTTTKPFSSDVDNQAEVVVSRTSQIARQRPMPWPHNRSSLPRRAPWQNITTIGPIEFGTRKLASQPKHATQSQPVIEEEEHSPEEGQRSEPSSEVTLTTTPADVTIGEAAVTPTSTEATFSPRTSTTPSSPPVTEVHIHTSEDVHTFHDTDFKTGDHHNQHMATGNKNNEEREQSVKRYFGDDVESTKSMEGSINEANDNNRHTENKDSGITVEGLARPTHSPDEKPSSSPESRLYFSNSDSKTNEDANEPEKHRTESKDDDQYTEVDDRNISINPINENKYLPSNDDQYRPSDEDRYKPSNGDKYRPSDDDRYIPTDGDKYRPSDVDRSEPNNGDRNTPSDEDRYKPNNRDRNTPSDGDRCIPSDGDRYRPSDKEQYKPSNGDRYRPGNGDRYRPSDRDRYRPSDEEQSKPSYGDRYGPGNGDRYRPSDRDRYRPSDRDRYRPSDRDRYRPNDRDRYRPSNRNRYRPSDHDRYRPSDQDRYRPSDPDRYRPSDQDLYRPNDEDWYKPSDGDRYRPIDEDRYRPRDEDQQHRPIVGDRYRPRDKNPIRPEEDDRYSPRDSDQYRPGDGDRNRPQDSDRYRPGHDDRYGSDNSDRFIPRDDDRNRAKEDDLYRPFGDYIPREEGRNSPRNDGYRHGNDDHYKTRDDERYITRDDLYRIRKDDRYRPKEEDRYRPIDDRYSPRGQPIAKDNIISRDEDKYISSYDDRYRLEVNIPHRTRIDTHSSRDSNTRRYGVDYYRPRDYDRYESRGDVADSGKDGEPKILNDSQRPGYKHDKHTEENSETRINNSERNGNHSSINNEPGRRPMEGDHLITPPSVKIRDIRSRRPISSYDQDEADSSWESHYDRRDSDRRRDDSRYSGTHFRERDPERNYHGSHKDIEDRRSYYPSRTSDEKYHDSERKRIRDDGRRGNDGYESRYYYPSRVVEDVRRNYHDRYSSRGSDESRRRYSSNDRYYRDNPRYSDRPSSTHRNPEGSRTYYSNSRGWDESRGKNSDEEIVLDKRLHPSSDSNNTNTLDVRNNKDDAVHPKESDQVEDRSKLLSSEILLKSDVSATEERYKTEENDTRSKFEEFDYEDLNPDSYTNRESYRQRYDEVSKKERTASRAADPSRAISADRLLGQTYHPRDHLSSRSDRVKQPESEQPLKVRHVIEAAQKESERRDQNRNVFYPVFHPRASSHTVAGKSPGERTL